MLASTGGGHVVEVVAVEAQPGLEAQAVARAEAGGEHAGLGQDEFGDGFGPFLADGDLEAVFAAVAGAADPDGVTADGGFGDAEEGKRGGLGAEKLHGGDGLRSLEREEGALRVLLEGDAGGEVFGDDMAVGLLAACVGHDDEAIAVIGDHEIVVDAAGFVQQHSVALPAGREALDVAGDELLERLGGASTVEAELAHVRDVEQRGVAARVEMFGHDAGVRIGRGGRSRRSRPSWRRGVGAARRAGRCAALRADRFRC